MQVKSTREAKRYLFNYNQDLVCKCGNSDFYNVSGFGRSCTKCKKKYSVTNGTIFHNVRFGFLKAFRIVIREYNNNFTSYKTAIAKEFKISPKTARKFLNKIRNNKEKVIDLIQFKNKPKKKKHKSRRSDSKKLNKFLKDTEKY